MLSENQKDLWSCAYFFAGPGLTWSLFTARLPALVDQVQADPAAVGMILFCLGASSLAAMFLTPFLLKHATSKQVLTASALLAPAAVIVSSLSPSLSVFFLTTGLIGFALGLADVTMNIQGVLFEKKLKRSKLAFFHSMFSFAAAFASFGSGFLTARGMSVFWNFVVIGVLYAAFVPMCAKRLHAEDAKPVPTDPSVKRKARVPLFIFICGIFCTFASETEGTVVDWGSLYVASLETASQALAALTFGFFSLTTAFCRLFCDRLRDNYGDAAIAITGCLLSAAGGLLIIYGGNLVLILLGFSLLGLGLAPIVPILFSAGGKCPGVTPAQSSSVISIFNYGGMLFVPPLIGFIVQHTSLSAPFWIATMNCLILAIGCGWLLNQKR